MVVTQLEFPQGQSVGEAMVWLDDVTYVLNAVNGSLFEEAPYDLRRRLYKAVAEIEVANEELRMYEGEA